MKTPRNTPRVRSATPLAALAAVLGLAPSPVPGGWAGGRTEAAFATAAATPAARPFQPQPAEAGELFNAARTALSAWDATTFDLPDTAFAAAVVLRLDGRPVGRGVAPNEQGSSVAPALALAMAEAERRLPVPNDTLRAERLRALAGRMTLSLELAGPLVPVEPAALSVSTLDTSPGIHGVAVRFAGSTGFIFPERLITAGMEPAQGALALIADATDDPALSLKPLTELQSSFGVEVFRFEVTHLAEPAPGAAAMFMHRGGRVLEPADIARTDAVRALAERLRAHLLSRLRIDTEGSVTFIRTIDPIRGESTPDERGFGMALTAMALERSARLDPALADPASTAPTLAACLTLLRALAELPPAQLEVPVAAAASATLRRLERLHDRPISNDPVLAAYLARCDELIDAALDRADALPGSITAAALYALAERWALTPDDAELTATLDEHLTKTLQQADPATAVAQWPWLGWTLQLVARDSASVRGAVLLRQIRSAMWRFQLDARTLAPYDRDLAGGILFRRTPQPLPTWQSARPLAFAASMLGDPRLTPEVEALDEIAPLIESIRFLAQLEHAEGRARLYASPPAHWQGGVRAAPWDHTLPVEASATTLIVVSETLASLDAIAARRAANAPADGP